MRSTLMAAAMLAAPAAATAACPAPYAADQLLTDMAAVEEALRAHDDSEASTRGDALETGLGCADEVLAPIVLGRVYRAIAAGKLSGGDEGRARQWFATAVEIDPSFEYGIAEVPEQHPVRDVYGDSLLAYTPAPTPVEGRVFASSAATWLDGRKLAEPEAVESRPHLLQLDAEGAVSSWVIDGNRFPDEVLADPALASDDSGGRRRGNRGDDEVGAGGAQRAIGAARGVPLGAAADRRHLVPSLRQDPVAGGRRGGRPGCRGAVCHQLWCERRIRRRGATRRDPAAPQSHQQHRARVWGGPRPRCGRPHFRAGHLGRSLCYSPARWRSLCAALRV